MKENLPSDNLKPSNCLAFLSISQSINRLILGASLLIILIKSSVDSCAGHIALPPPTSTIISCYFRRAAEVCRSAYLLLNLHFISPSADDSQYLCVWWWDLCVWRCLQHPACQVPLFPNRGMYCIQGECGGEIWPVLCQALTFKLHIPSN